MYEQDSWIEFLRACSRHPNIQPVYASVECHYTCNTPRSLRLPIYLAHLILFPWSQIFSMRIWCNEQINTQVHLKWSIWGWLEGKQQLAAHHIGDTQFVNDAHYNAHCCHNKGGERGKQKGQLENPEQACQGYINTLPQNCVPTCSSSTAPVTQTQLKINGNKRFCSIFFRYVLL